MQRLLLRLIGFCARLYDRTNRFGNEVPDEGDPAASRRLGLDINAFSQMTRYFFAS